MTEALDHYLDQRDEDYERQGETKVKINKDMQGRYFAITTRPLAINFPVRINSQTYWKDKYELKALLEYLGYTIAKECG